MFEDAKEEIREGENKDKGTNNDLQNTTQKTKDWATQPHLKSGVGSSWSISGTHHVTGCETTIDAYYSFILHA